MIAAADATEDPVPSVASVSLLVPSLLGFGRQAGVLPVSVGGRQVLKEKESWRHCLFSHAAVSSPAFITMKTLRCVQLVEDFFRKMHLFLLGTENHAWADGGWKQPIQRNYK